VLDVNGKSIEVDSRPSDALALAVRCSAKLFVDDDVMHEAGIEPEAGIDVGEFLRGSDVAVENIPGEESDLDIFRDFVDSLDLDDLG